MEGFAIRFAPGLWLRGLPFISLTLLVAVRGAYPIFPHLAFGLSAIFLLGVFIWDRLWLSLGRHVVTDDMSKGMRSANIRAELSSREGGSPIYFIAHYDSKSQPFSLYVRAFFFLLACCSAGLFNLWIWTSVGASWIGKGGFSTPSLVHGSFYLGVGLNLVLLLPRIANTSPGAIDNASGVGVLLELARVFASNGPRGLRPIFLFTGAEEMGLLGSLMYLKRHGKDMVRDRAWVVNIDSVAEKGHMRISSYGRRGRDWLRLLLLLAREEGFSLRRLRLLKGVMMDHLPFGQRGLRAVSLTSLFKEGFHLHTSRDHASLLRAEALEEVGRFLMRMVRTSDALEVERWVFV